MFTRNVDPLIISTSITRLLKKADTSATFAILEALLQSNLSPSTPLSHPCSHRDTHKKYSEKSYGNKKEKVQQIHGKLNHH